MADRSKIRFEERLGIMQHSGERRSVFYNIGSTLAELFGVDGETKVDGPV
jgi:hypothetical protein